MCVKVNKPEDVHLEFLDDLRDSGVTNMFGAGPYLTREFGVGKQAAREILGHWMDTFSARHGDSW